MGARPSGEWRYSARHRILGHERPGWCYPTGRCAYLPSVTCYRQSIKPPPPPGSKRVIHSDKAGALPLATGFPLETVQVRGRTDPYTQRKCDGAPRRRVGKGWSWELGHTRPTGCRGQARAESTADTEADAREMASLPGRWMTPSQATPPRSRGPAGKGCPPPRRGARSIL